MEMDESYGRWDALLLDIAAQLFADAPFRWWVSGGHALELHLGRSWREHDDMDVSFCRRDASVLRDYLRGWHIEVAAAGVLTPWDGGPLAVESHQNNLWCRQTADGPWLLDITVSDGDDEHWIYRRDPSLKILWADAVLRSRSNVPYLAPELQLLFKATHRRPKDDVDAAVVIPEVDHRRLVFLRSTLGADHPWFAHGR
jgi:Aminoglycoside-2''-adenylyltransferase